MKHIQLFASLPIGVVKGMEGTVLDDTAYDTLVGGADADEAVTILMPNGDPLAIYVPKAINKEIVERVRGEFREISLSGDLTNRGTAVLKGSNKPRIRKDGSIAKTNEVNPKLLKELPQTKYATNGVVGYMDANARFPYCRQTAYTAEHTARFQWCYPYVQAAHAHFEALRPSRHAAQHAMAEKTEKSWVIPGTCFTTLTVNRNWQTAVHTDAGDYKPGSGVLGCLRKGEYEGGYFTYPRWRVAIDLHDGDLIVGNVHEHHANTPLVNQQPGWERITIVMYYRENMFECDTPEYEEAKRKNYLDEDPETRSFASRSVGVTEKERVEIGRAPEYSDEGAEQKGLGL